MLPSQKTSIQENNGLVVNQSKKLEINQPAVHVGLSVLLKLCQTESVLNQVKNYKPEFQLKIF